MASSSNSSTIGNIQNLMPIVDGENYEYWSLQMKTLFISQDLWDLVEDVTPELRQALKENRKRDAKALFLLLLEMWNLFQRLLSATTSKNAWEILKIEFYDSQKVISIKLQSLWREFDNLLMKENESIQVFFTKVSGNFNQIRSYGDAIPDKKIVEKTLRSLPPKFDHVVAAIEESNDLAALSLHELIGSLEAHAKMINRSTDQSLEQAFQSKLDSKEKEDKQRGESQKSQNRKSKFHWRKNYNKGNYNNNNQQGRSHQNNQNGNFVPECYVCKKTGHKSADCRYNCTRCRIPNHSQRDCRYQKNNEANFTENNDSLEQLFYTCLSV
ncbi:hypothetical protein D8674_001721 [Pyrus ussuriensis x Pyrus communis]|uniref:CCHC-type domain-containing protein n=1 Tax=Pyrus ussuriensis x Pyrus communis TaxID=2448454 RepID=A0A5N5FA07_9ROSA|nr:hypothetical protein D8674_001721 [Pyrus ussuriensis x Pyrus communis]